MWNNIKAFLKWQKQYFALVDVNDVQNTLLRDMLKYESIEGLEEEMYKLSYEKKQVKGADETN